MLQTAIKSWNVITLDLKRGQHDQKTELQDLKAMLQTDIKSRNETALDFQKRQNDQNTVLQDLKSMQQTDIKSCNEIVLDLKKGQNDQKTELQDLKAIQQAAIKSWNETALDFQKMLVKSHDDEKTVLQDLKVMPHCSALDSQNWTTILRRQDGSVDFYRNWTEYKNGFGDPQGEFFICLDKLNEMTSKCLPQELMIVLKDWENEERFANYDLFQIGNESEGYAIKILGKYSGNAGDSLRFHEGMKFSTFDQDDGKYTTNCARRYHGAWWFYQCYHSHLNGIYRKQNEHKQIGVAWNDWKGEDYSLKFAEMKIRAKTP